MDIDRTGKPFPTLKNDLILRAARGEKVERVPVWVMRQAGRYLPEFKAARANHTFVETIQDPKLACEVTLQPIRRYGLDAAIIFSDILVVNKALGIDFDLVPEKGIVVHNPLKGPEDAARLNDNVQIEMDLGYVLDALTVTRHALEGKVPLIGFSGAPWTLMTYMVESDSSPGKELAKKWLYQHPETSHKILQRITDVIVDYAVHQVQAGAQMLQIFESHAGCLGPNLFYKFSLPYLKQISSKVKQALQAKGIPPVPMTVFPLGAHFAIEEVANSGYDVVGIDWTVSPVHARRLAGSHVTLQGNLDPAALFASKDDIGHLVKEMIQKFGTQRYIANLGHGINKTTDPEHMGAFVEAVYRYSSEADD